MGLQPLDTIHAVVRWQYPKVHGPSVPGAEEREDEGGRSPLRGREAARGSARRLGGPVQLGRSVADAPGPSNDTARMATDVEEQN